MPELTPVRGIITTPITLSGVGQISYGVTVGSTGATERWCYNPSPVSPGGGIYDVTTAGVWTRVTDLDFSGGAGDFANMPWFHVREGNERIAGSEWWYSGPQVPTENVTSITFTKRSHGDAWVPGTGMDTFNNEMRLIERSGVVGTWASPNLTITDRGVIQAVSGGESGSTFIEGLRLVYDGAAALTVEAGAAFAPGAGTIDMDDESKTGLVLTASTWYYIYLFSNNGIGDWEISTQKPASPYMGNARTKGGPDNTDPDVSPDFTRRLLGARRAGATNTLHRFFQAGNLVYYDTDHATGTAFRVLDDGRAATYTTVDCSGVVPPTARRAYISFYQRSSQFGDLSHSGVTGSIYRIPAVQHGFTIFVELDSLQRFQYKFDSAPSAGFGMMADVLGFVEEV